MDAVLELFTGPPPAKRARKSAEASKGPYAVNGIVVNPRFRSEDGGVALCDAVVPAGKSSEWITQRVGFEEVFDIRKGTGRVFLGGSTDGKPVVAGSVVYVPSKESVRIEAGSEDVHFTVFSRG